MEKNRKIKILRIKEIFKFSLSSIISFIIDYSLFMFFSFIINSISICNILARTISASCNYAINRKYVFKKDNNLYKSLLSYFVLAIVIIIINTMLLNIFIYKLMINKSIAKITVEIIMFIISFIVQQRIIFKKN